MIQLIDRLPFDSTTIQSLKTDWTRFKDGSITFDQVTDAICGEFDCEAEMQVNSSCAGSGDEGEGEGEEDDGEYEKELLKYLPSGNGKLIITIR